MRVSPIPVARSVGSLYVNTIRNTPLTLVFFAFAFALPPLLGLRLTADVSLTLAVCALGIYTATYVAETIRSGINTVPVGQAEAARAIGLGFWPAARLVILPQAFRGAVAPLGNVLIALIKNSTVAAAGSVAETSGLMKTMIEFRPDVILAVFLTFAIGYVIIVVPVGLATTSLSRRLAVAR